MELSSEVPGTNANWPSDISVWVNDVMVGTWTSPGDFGDKRGIYTPRWWKLEGSQYGHLKTCKITERGTYLDGKKVSSVDARRGSHLDEHHSIRLRIGIDEHAKHPGGVNIFGKGFGNYDQDIMLAAVSEEGAAVAPGIRRPSQVPTLLVRPSARDRIHEHRNSSKPARRCRAHPAAWLFMVPGSRSARPG